MKHVQNYSDYNLNEAELCLNEQISKIVEVYGISDFDKLDETLLLLTEGLGDKLGMILGKIFPTDLTTEQLIIHYARYASLISSFIPVIGTATSLSIEVILILYWTYKYSIAKDQASRDEASSELVVGLFIVVLTGLMVPGARLFKGLFKTIFKSGAKGAEKMLRGLQPQQLSALQKLSTKAIPALSKTEQVLFKVLNKLERFLPKRVVRGIKMAFTKFKNSAKSLSKKSVKQSDDALEAGIKAGDDTSIWLNMALKQNKALDVTSVKSLTSRMKAAKFPTKEIENVFSKLSKDKTGGLDAFDYIMDSKMLMSKVNIFDKHLLKNYKIQFNGKQMPMNKALKSFQSKLKKVPNSTLNKSDSHLTFINGKATRTTTDKLLSFSKNLATLPFRLTKKLTTTLIKILTYTNRQIVYVVDETLTSVDILKTFQKGVDTAPGLNKSKKYLDDHPELVVIKYKQNKVTYYPMNYSTNTKGDKPIEYSEFIGMKMYFDNIKKTELFNDFDIPKSKKGYMEYYSIVSVDTTPELNSIVMFAIDYNRNDKTLYAVDIDKNAKKFKLSLFKGYDNVVDATVIDTLNSASDITKQNYGIVEDRIKDYEEDERPEQKRLGSLLQLNRMTSKQRGKFKKMYMRDLDDVKSVKQIHAKEDEAKLKKNAS